MTPVRILVVTVLLGAAACTQPPPELAADAVQQEPAQLWSADTRTILTGEAARSLASQCSRVSPGPVEDVWTPSAEQIEALEDDLILRVARELEARNESPSPGAYYRQYAGLVIGGKRIIYVNGVDEGAIAHEPNPDHPFDWRTQAVRICDGGTITFGAEYDPATQRFANFAFNGSI